MSKMGPYRDDRATMLDKYPLLLALDEQDIRFEFIPHSVRQKMAMKLDINVLHWKCVAEEMKLAPDVISWIPTLTTREGSNALKLFDIYVREGENSVRLFRDALIKAKCQDVLLQLCIGWEKILKEVKRSGKEGLVQPQDTNSKMLPGCNRSLQAVTVFVTHLYRHWEHHHEESRFSKQAVSLGRYLKQMNLYIQMDVPNMGRIPTQNRNWREWIDHKFSMVNYILVCLSPTYLDAVSAEHLDEDDENRNITDNVLSTRYIYHLMQQEFHENGAINRRFIPILFTDGIQRASFPNFLQTCPAYRWTADFEALHLRLIQPDRKLANLRTRSGVGR